jgi:hypothetical protein
VVREGIGGFRQNGEKREGEEDKEGCEDRGVPACESGVGGRGQGGLGRDNGDMGIEIDHTPTIPA